MNALSFARKSLVAASICAAFAATGCVATDDDDFDDEDYGTKEGAVTATNATNITSLATSAGQKALGAVGGAAFTKILGAFGIYGTSNISKASMQEIANLVGTTVRSEFLNTYEAKLHAAYDAAEVYSRTCTTSATCKPIVGSLHTEAWDIYNSANQVAEYYKLDALSKDRLTVAPQLVNALTLKTSFLLERWQLYKFQNPNGDNSQYKQAACNSADGAVSVLNAVEKQFNDFVPTKITTVYAKKQGFGCGKGCTYTKIVAYCYKDYGTEKCVSGSSVTTKNTATAQRNARVAEVRSKILGDNFNTARTQLTQMGDLCP